MPKFIFYLVRGVYELILKLNPQKLGVHAVIPNAEGRVLVLRSAYEGVWSFAGGGVNAGESVDEALLRECREELGQQVQVQRFVGFYYRPRVKVHSAVFRCAPLQQDPTLSIEHTAWAYVDPRELPEPLSSWALRALSEEAPEFARFKGQ